MAISSSSSDTPSARASSSSSSSSSSKDDQKKLLIFKKKALGPAPAKKKKKKVAVGSQTSKKKSHRKTLRDTIDNIRMSQQGSDPGVSNSPALDRAIVVQSNLSPDFPTCVKYMLKSHVTGGFWLSLPKSFCDTNLPKEDETIWLVGDHAKEFKTNYLIEKNGLSGGWRTFAISHNLLEGDVLVFQLIQPLKFKVHIMRAKETSEIDGAEGLINFHSQAKALDNSDHSEEDELEEDVKNIEMTSTDKCLDPSEKETGISNRNTDASCSESSAAAKQTENEDDEHGSEDMEGIRLAKSTLVFKDVKSFNGFSILVDGLVIDTKIPMHLRYKYYELCRSQKSFLHDNLVKGINCKLAVGIISETVNIADGIKAARLDVSLEHLQSWDKTLKAFEEMGMKVGFLRTRLDKLICLLYEQQEIIRSKKEEQVQLDEEIKDLQSRLPKRFEVKKELDAEIEGLMGKHSSDLVVKFKNTANAPW